MNPQVAEKLLVELDNLNPGLEKIAEIIEEIDNDEEKKRNRRAFAEIFIQIGENLIIPIVNEHANLSRFHPIKS